MARIRFILLTVAFASTLFSVQATAQAFRDPNVDLAPALGGGTLTCSPTEKILIAKPFAERAKLKARLIDRLRESIYDDAKGIVNFARDEEIRNLASKLKDDKTR